MSKAESTQVKPFEAIPGPRSLPYIGTLYKYLPFGENISIPLFFLFYSHLDPYTGYNIKVMKSFHVNRVYYVTSLGERVLQDMGFQYSKTNF